MKCSYCNKPIKLIPSASERAQRYGGEPSDYTKLFTIHAQCTIDKRNADTLELMQRIKTASKPVRFAQESLSRTGNLL